MTRTVDARLGQVVSIVHDLVLQGGTEFPYRALQPLLHELFRAEPSWQWMDSVDEFGFVMLEERTGWPLPDDMDYWRTTAMARHPLLRWFAVTNTQSPMSIDRVPDRIASAADKALVREQMSFVGLEQQLSIPYEQGATSYRAFVMARDGRDFDDCELELAVRIQPLLMLLNRQVSVLAGRSAPAIQSGPQHSVPQTLRHESTSHEQPNHELTGRQLAVLTLMADGLTAAAIGHRLGTSPRTVQKHLEAVYRKLDATDRVTAVRIALDDGLIDQHRCAAVGLQA
jgi:DNA-binding CsgD family transcriptional regulator